MFQQSVQGQVMSKKKSVPCQECKYWTQWTVVDDIRLNIKKMWKYNELLESSERIAPLESQRIYDFTRSLLPCYLVYITPAPFLSTSLAFSWLSHIPISILKQCCSGKLKRVTAATTLEKAEFVFSDCTFSSIHQDSMRTFTVSELQTLIWWLISVNSPCHVTASRD